MSLGPVPISLIVPPTDFFLPCAAGLFILSRWGRLARAGYTLLIIGLGGLFVLSLPVVSKTLIYSLEAGLPLEPPSDNPPGAIVILSGDASRNGGVLDIGGLTLERERAGAVLHRRTGLPILVTGGPIGGSKETFATLMSQSLQSDFQVPTRWLEPVAEDTMENGRFSTVILHREGIRSVYLVTHAWHMRRSLLAFAGSGIAVTAAPVQMDSLPNGDLGNFFPRASAWLDSYFALHEWIGYIADSAPFQFWK